MTHPEHLAQQDAHRGPFGEAVRLTFPDIAATSQTVDGWLITAPTYHPLWSQYSMSVVRLDDDAPGFPPPYHQFPGTTHELLVMALNPDHGPQTAETMTGYAETGGLPYLTPVNHAHQFIACDQELRQLASLAAWGVVNGHLNPETGDAPALIREAWLASLTKTLAHIRGEAHAR